MKKHLVTLCTMVLGLSAVTPSIARAMDVSFEKDSSLPLVYINVAVKTGAASDPWKELGLSNFMGDLMLRGTTSRDKEQINLALDQIGAQLDVETRSEAMIFRGACLSSQLDPFLSILKEIITRPSFPDDEIVSLKSEIESQILEEHSSDERLASLAFASFLFGDHPYAKPILGKVNTIRELTREEIVRHYRDVIADDTILVLGSGDADSSKITQWAKSLGGGIPAHPAHSLPKISAPQNPSGVRLLIVDKPDRTQTQIVGGQVGIKMTDPDFFPIFLANEAFGGESFSSRLMSEIRVKRGWSYGADSYFKYSKEPRSWQFYLFPAEKDTPPALSKTLQLVHELKDNGITPGEFSFSKERLVNSSGFMYDTPAKRVENTLVEKMLGLPDGFMKSYGPKLEKLSLKEVNDAIEKFVRPEDLSIVVVGTEKNLKSKLAQAVGIPEANVKVVPYTEE